MKKLFLMLLFVFSGISISTSPIYAASVVISIEDGVVPASKKEKLKTAKKQLREIRREFRKEMKGMTRAEKRAFIQDKIGQNQLDIPNLKLLIIGLALIVAGAIFYIIPNLGWLGGLVQGIGGIIILVWLILWLMEL